jgi:TetR/AcrR family transcriptional repressor of mexJK operon
MTDAEGQIRQAGRPKSAAKRDAIIDAARRQFTREPFERVSLDAVAAEAGVSKVTIYSHFPNKEALFIAAIGAGCSAVFDRVNIEMGAGDAVALDETLTQLGLDFLEMIFDPEVDRLHAVILGEGPRHPELPQMFYEAVLVRSTQTFADFLAAQTAAGRISCGDPFIAATQFLSIVQGDFRYRVELGLPRVCRDDMEIYVRSCVALVLKSWAP